MPDVTPDRQNILQEEVRYRAAVSESTFSKIGASVNFINDKQYDSKVFFINGDYYLPVQNLTLGKEGVDGLYVGFNNFEIVGLWMFNIVNGISGTTELDIHWLDASNSDQGSIFSVTPKISFTAGNSAFMAIDLINSTSQGGTGITLPTFSKTQFDQFDALRLDIVDAQDQAQNAGLGIWMRPRN